MDDSPLYYNMICGRIEFEATDGFTHGKSFFCDDSTYFVDEINAALKAAGHKFSVKVDTPESDAAETVVPQEIISPPKFDVGDKVTVVADVDGGGMFLADDQKVDGMSGIVSFVNPKGEQKYLVYFKGYEGGHSGNGQDAGPYWYVTEESLRRTSSSGHPNMILR